MLTSSSDTPSFTCWCSFLNWSTAVYTVQNIANSTESCRQVTRPCPHSFSSFMVTSWLHKVCNNDPFFPQPSTHVPSPSPQACSLDRVGNRPQFQATGTVILFRVRVRLQASDRAPGPPATCTATTVISRGTELRRVHLQERGARRDVSFLSQQSIVRTEGSAGPCPEQEGGGRVDVRVHVRVGSREAG